MQNNSTKYTTIYIENTGTSARKEYKSTVKETVA